MTRRKKHRGFNLIEAAIVLGVVGLVIGGIWVVAAAVSENMKVNTVYSGILTMNTKLRETYRAGTFAEEAAFFKNITATAIASGVVPATLLDNGNMKNPWGGTMYIYGYNFETQGLSFHINAANMPKSACIKLVTQMLATAQSLGLVSITVAPAGMIVSVTTLTNANISQTYCRSDSNQQLGFRFL